MINSISGVSFQGQGGRVLKSIPNMKITTDEMVDDIAMVPPAPRVYLLNCIDDLKNKLEQDVKSGDLLGIGFVYSPFNYAKICIADINNTYKLGQKALLAEKTTTFDRSDGIRFKDDKIMKNIDTIFSDAYRQAKRTINESEIKKAQTGGKSYIYDRLA